MPSILLVGASGYVGGALLVSLKKSNPEYEITAIVRNASQVDPIRATGANNVVLASENFLDEIRRISADSDVVVNAANSDDLDLATAVLHGLKARFDSGKGAGILIHVSGAAIFLDGGVDGKLNTKSKVWNDGSEDDIKTITPDMLHGNVDVPILKAGEEGYVKTYILCPSIIYGRSSGPLSKYGAFHKISLGLTQEKGYAFYIGEGSNLCGTIHVEDVVSLLSIVLNSALSHPPTGSAYTRYIIASTGDVDWRTIADALGAAFYEKGLTSSVKSQSVSPDEVAKAFSGFVGGSALTITARAKALGWKPSHPSSGFKQSFASDISELLALSNKK